MNRGIAAIAFQATLISVLISANSYAADLVEVWQAAKGYDSEYLSAQADQSAGMARRDIGDTLLKPSVNLVASVGLVKQSSELTGAQFSMPGSAPINDAGFNTSLNSGTQTKYAIQASLPLFDRELSAQKSQLQLSADVTDMGMLAADRRLILRVAENYFETVKTQAVIKLLEEQQNAVANTYTEISRRQNLGDASKIDLHATAGQVEAIKAKIMNVQLAYKNNLLALVELTGQEVKTNSLEEEFNPASISAGKASEWIQKAKLNSPQLKMLALQEQVKSAEIDKYGSSLSPRLNLVAQIGREEAKGSGDYGSASNLGTNNMVGLQLSVPLTDGYRSAKKSEAFHMAKKAKLEYEHASHELEKQINSIWFALNTGRDRIESLTRIVTLSRDKLAATERSHRQGSRTTMELLGAQSDYISSKMVLLEEQVNFIVNRIRLSAIAGEISEQDLISANRYIAKK